MKPLSHTVVNTILSHQHDLLCGWARVVADMPVALNHTSPQVQSLVLVHSAFKHHWLHGFV